MRYRISCCRCRDGITRRMPPRRSRSRIELGVSDDAIRRAIAGFGGVKRRFTKTGEYERRHRDRRLWPSSRGDRGGTESGARIHQWQDRRRGAAASLHAIAVAVRRFLHLLQRRRRGRGRRSLSGRRGADRRHRPRSFRHGFARARPSRGDPAAEARRSCGHRQRPRRQAAISSSVSAPATSRNGPMRCPAN